MRNSIAVRCDGLNLEEPALNWNLEAMRQKGITPITIPHNWQLQWDPRCNNWPLFQRQFSYYQPQTLCNPHAPTVNLIGLLPSEPLQPSVASAISVVNKHEIFLWNMVRSNWSSTICTQLHFHLLETLFPISQVWYSNLDVVSISSAGVYCAPIWFLFFHFCFNFLYNSIPMPKSRYSTTILLRKQRSSTVKLHDWSLTIKRSTIMGPGMRSYRVSNDLNSILSNFTFNVS